MASKFSLTCEFTGTSLEHVILRVTLSIYIGVFAPSPPILCFGELQPCPLFVLVMLLQ